ncbi:hypothetical protein A2U01_0022747 [Trifolium medium]|uniref:Uncharacterized protein n=1 Tax=Trifolium medium TaxID=97028 RepID=A0A392NR84_9FABA|nr:hypothetical protein [Trifolium medium]
MERNPTFPTGEMVVDSDGEEGGELDVNWTENDGGREMVENS